jgi:hypothetical protein
MSGGAKRSSLNQSFHEIEIDSFLDIWIDGWIYLSIQISFAISPDCYRWRSDDEVDDRPVGKPQEEGMINIAASFSLSKKPRFNRPVGKRQT